MEGTPRISANLEKLGEPFSEPGRSGRPALLCGTSAGDDSLGNGQPPTPKTRGAGGVGGVSGGFLLVVSLVKTREAGGRGVRSFSGGFPFDQLLVSFNPLPKLFLIGQGKSLGKPNATFEADIQ